MSLGDLRRYGLFLGAMRERNHRCLGCQERWLPTMSRLRAHMAAYASSLSLNSLSRSGVERDLPIL